MSEEGENVLVVAAYLLALALLVLGNTEGALIVFGGASAFGLAGYWKRARDDLRRRRAAKADRQAEVYRRAEVFPMLMIWQCSANPEHRGWRYPEDPVGTCDICLARTAFEHEVITAGRTYTPTHPEGLI